MRLTTRDDRLQLVRLIIVITAITLVALFATGAFG